jgi:threonine/homoserine/homoserine lactone efflux protein
LDKFLNNLERRFGRYAVHGLMKYVCGLYVIGLLIELVNPQIYTYFLSLNPAMILRGQIWRLVTFLIQPPNTSLLFFIFSL